MKQSNQKQMAGVWLDNEHAIIITQSEGNESKDFTIGEKIKAHAGQTSGSEHNINQAKQSNSLKYFKNVSARLQDYDEILVFGPGKAQEQFQNHLQEDAQFNQKKITIDSAEHLTDPQMIAKVRDHFNKH